MIYKEVIEEFSFVDALYIRCQAWFAKTYVSTQKIVQANISGQEMVGKRVGKVHSNKTILVENLKKIIKDDG